MKEVYVGKLRVVEASMGTLSDSNGRS